MPPRPASPTDNPPDDWPGDLPFLRRAADGTVSIELKVQPNAARTAPAGLHDGALRLRLQAPPVDGRANQALLVWLARELDVPRSALTLEAGSTSTHKRLRVAATAAQSARWSRLRP